MNNQEEFVAVISKLKGLWLHFLPEIKASYITDPAPVALIEDTELYAKLVKFRECITKLETFEVKEKSI